MTAPLSKFLPDAFDQRPIGLIAGKGRYPILTAERIRAAGLPLRVVSFAGETEQSLRAQQFAGLGYGVMLTEATLEKNSLWDAVRRAGQLDRSKPMSLNTDGASTSVKILQQSYEAYCA